MKLKIGTYDWTNVEWSKHELQQFKDFQYMILYAVFVIADVVTTTMLMNNPLIEELNPIVSFLYTLPLCVLIYTMVKHIVLEVLFTIIRYQNRLYKNSGYITYFVILLMSIYVISNNIYLLYTLK